MLEAFVNTKMTPLIPQNEEKFFTRNQLFTSEEWHYSILQTVVNI